MKIKYFSVKLFINTKEMSSQKLQKIQRENFHKFFLLFNIGVYNIIPSPIY